MAFLPVVVRLTENEIHDPISRQQELWRHAAVRTIGSPAVTTMVCSY
jgi:hypothetical protein